MPHEKKIEINKAYVLLSGVMGRPYVSPEERASYVFLKKTEADLFVDKVERHEGPFAPQRFETLLVDEPRYYELDALIGLCLAAGAKKIILQTGTEEETIPATIRGAAPGFYNPDLAYWAAMVKTVRKTSSLDGISECRMIIPARITDNGANIEYGCVIPPDGSDPVNLAFTDLNTYQVWASKAPGWEPLLMPYADFWDAGGKFGFVLDIIGNRIVVNKDMAEKLPVPQKKESKKNEDVEV